MGVLSLLEVGSALNSTTRHIFEVPDNERNYSMPGSRVGNLTLILAVVDGITDGHAHSIQQVCIALQ
jgi:hypothetical protein